MERVWDRHVVPALLAVEAPEFLEACDEFLVLIGHTRSMVRDAAPAAMPVWVPADAMPAAAVRDNDEMNEWGNRAGTDATPWAEPSPVPDNRPRVEELAAHVLRDG